jgi:hypothetical protein
MADAAGQEFAPAMVWARFLPIPRFLRIEHWRGIWRFFARKGGPDKAFDFFARCTFPGILMESI